MPSRSIIVLSKPINLSDTRTTNAVCVAGETEINFRRGVSVNRTMKSAMIKNNNIYTIDRSSPVSYPNLISLGYIEFKVVRNAIPNAIDQNQNFSLLLLLTPKNFCANRMG